MKENSTTVRTSYEVTERKENRSENILKYFKGTPNLKPTRSSDLNNPENVELLQDVGEPTPSNILDAMRKIGRVEDSLESAHKYDLAEMKRITRLYANNDLLRLPTASTLLINDRFNSVCLAAASNALLGIVSFVSSAIVYDLEYYKYWNENYNLWLQVSLFNTAATFILIASIVWRNKCELDLSKAENIYSEYDNMISSKKVYLLVLEILVNFPHPLFFLKDIEVEFFNDVKGVFYYHSLNSLLCVIVTSRLYHVFRLVLLMSKFNSGRAHRVCKMNGVVSGRVWALKCIMIDYPFTVVLCMFLIGIIPGGYCLRIFERPLTIITETNGRGFYDLYNCMWYIIITMTTVGFGDLTPASSLGRIVGTFACIWGVFVVALMVVGVNRHMTMDSGQGKSFIIHSRLKFKNSFKVLAAHVLRSAFKFRIIMKKSSEDQKLVSIHQSIYKRNIIEFQKARLQSKILYNLHTPERKIEEKINTCLENAEKTLDKAKNVYETLFNMQKNLMPDSENPSA